MKRAPLALAPWALLACAHAPSGLAFREDLSAPVGPLRVTFGEEDRAAAEQVARAAEKASPMVSRWGALHSPVTLALMPSHGALESAVGRHGYDWLRAWARYDLVYVQSPRTWSLLGASARSVEELLAHELTHCLMYQLSASPADWAQKGIPLWFREGMASVTSDQGYRRMGLLDLETMLHERPELDPVRDAEKWYRDESEAVYGAAHHAFALFARRYGDSAVKDLMGRMRAGAPFAAAFAQAAGIEEQAFEREFLRYLRLEGFRSSTLR